MVHAASVRVLACRLRACVRQLAWRGNGHGGRCLRARGGAGVAHNLQRVCPRLLEDVEHVTGMSSSHRSCLWWSSQPKSWPMLLSSACEVVRE